MNTDPENFEALRHLLALKRHEQPPPGYYDELADQVIARIRMGDKGQPETVIERILNEAPWLHGFCAALEGKPAFAGAFGAAVCAVLIGVVVYSEKLDQTAVMPAAIVHESIPSLLNVAAEPAPEQSLAAMQLVGSSTNPLAPSGGSLFDQPPLGATMPASYTVPSGR